MTPVLARDALDERVLCVPGEETVRRVEAEGGTIFAVFSFERAGPRFIGLVTEHELARGPTRIFADLVEPGAYPEVLEDWSVERAFQHLDQRGSDLAAVRERSGTFLGIVTRASLLTVLLARSRHLAETLEPRHAAAPPGEPQYSVLAERSPVGVFVLQDDVLTYVNPRLCEIFDCQRDNVTGVQGLADFIVAEQRETLNDRIKACLAGRLASVHEQLQGERTDGSRVHVELFASREQLGGNPVVLGTIMDITEQKDMEARLRYLAYHDSLTGLPNRTQFTDRAEAALARAKREGGLVGILFLDLDQFKDINDTLGHEIGDEVLKEVARRLKARLRSYDVLSRWSGDEFCVLLPDLSSPDECAAVAQGLLEVLGPSLNVRGHTLYVTASIGTSFFPLDAEAVTKLLQLADAAMYEAKNQGGGVVCLRREFSEAIARRMNISHHLRGALERNEFYLEFQPVVDLATDRVVSVEALLRWRHPEFGLISPQEFVPLLEHNGLMEKVLEWVLQGSLHAYNAWTASECAPGHVSVNVPARLLRNQRLLETVGRVLTESGVQGDRLELEVREDVFDERNGSGLTSVLAGLREMGVMLSLDDFGTGCSSLSQLKQLPLSGLKMDRSLVREIPASEEWVSIVHAVVSIGRSLGLETVAEGVERADQLSFLLGEGCPAGQGYYISPPMPAQAIHDWLQVAKRRGWREIVWH